ncbi:lactonase family protein [Luteolibacter algae]|uniref:Lactonase family protein n=1 Tax=Luteolibacter algae TaxID=454151 RepID=A0ABW5D3S8_9BACT
MIKHFLPVCLLSLLCGELHAAPQSLYLAAGEKISVYTISPETGELTPSDGVDLAGVGPFTFSADGSKMYASASVKGDNRIATLERAGNGALEVIDSAPVTVNAGYLDLDKTGNYLAANSYQDGTVSVWKLEDGVFRGELVQELALEQHAHGANFSPDNRWLLVPATSPNKVFVQAFDENTGEIVPNKPAFGQGPKGEKEARNPRHLIFHPAKNDIAYTTNEKYEPGVCVWKWNGTDGTLTPIQNIVTIPEEFSAAGSTATLRLTPDHRFLYVSNRRRDGKSSIAAFRVDSESGRLQLISHTPCENMPRSFCIDRTGSFIYVAGREDGFLGVYKIDQNSGALTKVTQYEVGKGTRWVEAR